MPTSRSPIPRDVRPDPEDPLQFYVKSRSEPEPHLCNFSELDEPACRMGWCSCDAFYFRVGPDNRNYGFKLQCHHLLRATQYMCAKLEEWGFTVEDFSEEESVPPPLALLVWACGGPVGAPPEDANTRQLVTFQAQ